MLLFDCRRKASVLLDTGWGYGDLKAVVASITDLPVTVVLSHGHPDHVGGASQFEQAYLNSRDDSMIASESEVGVRRRLMLNSVPKDFEEEENSGSLLELSRIHP